MVYIDHIPSELKRLMDSMTVALTKPQAAWLPPLVLAMAVCGGRRTVKSLSMLLDPRWARSSLNDYFSQSPWPAPEVLRAATLDVLEQMRLQPDERIEVILDGTQKGKRGSFMDALGWVKEATSKQWRKGHRLVLCYLRVRGVMLPWAIDIYLSKKFLASDLGRAFKERIPGTRFRTTNEIAAEMVRGLPAEWKDRYEVVVLMDSGFCNRTACGAVREMGFTYVVAAQSTRVMVKSTVSGRRGKRVVLRAYASGRLRYQGANVVLPAKRSGGRVRRYRVAETVGKLNGLGEVKVVFSQRRSDGSILPIVTNDLGMGAREVALMYGWRWEIEVAIKALKGCLGLGQYQCRYYEGMVHHLHLSLLAHLTLTAAELARRGRTARSRAALQLPSVAVLQSRLRQDLMRAILDQLRPRCASPEVLTRLERALAVSA